jgi:hypothetical protein
MFYTSKEKSEKRYSVGSAESVAREILINNHNITSVCVDALRFRNLDVMIALPEFNDIVEQLIADSLFRA